MGKQDMPLISVKNLFKSELGTTENTVVDESASELDLPESIELSNITGKVKLMRLEESVAVKADLRAEVGLICDRCLDNFDTGIKFKFDREYQYDRKAESEDNLYVDKHMNIDLGPEIRDELLLAIPFQNLCSDKCGGICPTCGVNLNHETCKCNIK